MGSLAAVTVYAQEVTAIDLRRLRLRPGEVRRERVEVELDPFVLGGQRYEASPATFPVAVQITHASGATVFDLGLHAHLTGPCMRCLGFAEVERTISDLAERARDNKLTLEELTGGTFTISNGGIYGSLLSTPILNPPQSGILGLHAIEDRPAARGGQVVIRPMMFVALTYDHRIVDGREAVGFLKRVKACIEQPARILLEA